MLKKPRSSASSSKSEPAAKTQKIQTNELLANELIANDLLASDEAELRYDQQDSQEEAPGSNVATARYIADLVGSLAAMASDAKLDLLTYLLNMARVEAEMQARRSNDAGDLPQDDDFPEDDDAYPQG